MSKTFHLIAKLLLTALLILSAAGSVMCLPSTFDWRDVNGTNYVTPVRDQGSCGSCGVFSIIAAVEATILIEHPNITDIDLSEQYFISDCWLDGDCSETWLGDVTFAIVRYGVPLESCDPYLGQNSSCACCDDWRADGWSIETRSEIGYGSDDYYKNKIMDTGPIAFVMLANQWHVPDRSGYPSTQHAALIVGWNDTEGVWIAKNSYGPAWGDNGYGKILYGSLGCSGRDVYTITGAYCMNNTCPWDLTGDGVVNNDDSLEIILNWGPCNGCSEDLTCDGYVNNADVLQLLDHWGACP